MKLAALAIVAISGTALSLAGLAGTIIAAVDVIGRSL